MSLSQAEAVVDTTGGHEDVGGSLVTEAWRRLRRDAVAITGAVMVAIFVLVAIFAPLLAPHSTTEQVAPVTPVSIPGPSSEFWFGVNDLGRDQLSLVIFGSRQSLIVGVMSLLIGMIVGMGLGWRSRAFSSRSASPRCSARACDR